ncbi:MAG: hypothetical protein KDE34_22345 [Anaerolineales bacterium]|nr:hypothetical protein [Anaerolineales bacterium]
MKWAGISRWAARIFGSCLLLLALWHIAAADDVAPSIPAYPLQAQARDLTSLLLDSEAEHAQATYVPRHGLVLAVDVIRGPNTSARQTAEEGTRDWAIYLLGDLVAGALVEPLPAGETITLAIDFYDQRITGFRQLVVVAPAAALANTATYQFWLDGQPLVIASGAADATDTAALPEPLLTTDLAEILPFDQSEAATQWLPLSGDWRFRDGLYFQDDELNFDRISYLARPLAPVYTYTVQLRFEAGKMGGGLVFNAPDTQFRANAQMVSYTNDGAYLQWGYFSADGAFVFQGGAAVADVSPGADGDWHELAVRVDGAGYAVLLDGAVLAEGIALFQRDGGYVGLFASTSQVAFRAAQVEGAWR